MQRMRNEKFESIARHHRFPVLKLIEVTLTYIRGVSSPGRRQSMRSRGITAHAHCTILPLYIALQSFKLLTFATKLGNLYLFISEYNYKKVLHYIIITYLIELPKGYQGRTIYLFNFRFALYESSLYPNQYYDTFR